MRAHSQIGGAVQFVTHPVIRCLFAVCMAAGALVVCPSCSKAQTTPPSTTCTADSDCTVTCASTNQCCGQGCSCSNVMTTSQASAIREWQSGNCDYSDDDLCPVYSCPEVNESNHAVCFETRCILVTTASGSSPDPNRVCVQDSDCVLTRANPGNCCDDTCNLGRVLNSAVVEEHTVWKATECSDAVCPVADCLETNVTRTAVCDRGQCGVQETVR